ncbi:predicted protein [Phaeodactylum tricornutum CCAP 1055/1]|jgi:hypothetical protein|uniref:Uncharacterized protein n=2 Tax=Phaeodactylum tricornutum TaxID=2850 RepID=B7G3D7_PHATC|nr:predicted protein [Phaeodactylum tricornutum CCAP 1055/1]EEC46814.1 predicted protein [Phaeodactylum tricornutum CCAP 1055/1]|eukprot:XP_002181600.1 predicted protein [Phaeodactylum tricornutum CCAP 1055/1]
MTIVQNLSVFVFVVALTQTASSFVPQRSPVQKTFLSRIFLGSQNIPDAHGESPKPTVSVTGYSSLPAQDRRQPEFQNLEPLPENETRQQRIDRETRNRDCFAEFGDDLWNLRDAMNDWSRQLISSLASGTVDFESDVREKLRQAEARDPELVYMLALADAHEAKTQGQYESAKAHEERAQAARSCLPQFQLDGLWVGKYGSHGYEMINVTYVGDTLIATKITGDKNVPRGEITFQADLHPLCIDSSNHPDANKPFSKSSSPLHKMTEPLQPIQLTDKAARKWGTRQLSRYGGLGQVAEEGFRNHQYMDGQLIIIGDGYFSFAWVPIEQQIFFGRPSPELALKMLKNSGISKVPGIFDQPPSIDAHVETQKEYAMRCLELTDEHRDEVGNNDFSCIWTGSDADECYFE